MHTPGSSTSFIDRAVDKVRFNKDAFISRSGLITRGALGYLCCFCPQAASLMREHLKEKVFVCNGLPLACNPHADDILNAYLIKNNLSVCPFSCTRELTYSPEILTTASRQTFCSAACCAIGCCSFAAGSLAQAATGNAEMCAICAGTVLTVFGFPYAKVAEDSFLLYFHEQRFGHMQPAAESSYKPKGQRKKSR